MNWDFIESVEFKGAPREEDLRLIGDRVKEPVKIVKESVKYIDVKCDTTF